MTVIANIAEDKTRDIRDLPDGVTYEPGDADTVRHAKVYDAPDIQDPCRHQRDIMRPRRVEIRIKNGVVTNVCVFGPAVRRDGTTGMQEKLRWYGRHDAGTEPAWLVALVRNQGLCWPGRTERDPLA